MAMRDEAKLDAKHRFLFDHVFNGLKNLNTGFDSPLIPHVSPDDFGTVLERCIKSGAEVLGVEVFDVSNWPAGKVEMLEVEISPEEESEWVRRLVRKYAGQPNITFCATFYIPEELAKRKAGMLQSQPDLEEALRGEAM